MTCLASESVVMHLDVPTQDLVVAQAREVIRMSPLVRPRTPNGLDMQVLVTNAGALGWVADEHGYRYTPTDASGKPWPSIPALWLKIADVAAGSFCGDGEAGPIPWDSAILNWYAPTASLGWHRDRHEADMSKPIVTISLGDACSWAMRADEHSPISRTRLESGGVTLLAGPTRLALHTVERIIPAPMFSPLRKPGRLSITIRCAGRNAAR